MNHLGLGFMNYFLAFICLISFIGMVSICIATIARFDEEIANIIEAWKSPSSKSKEILTQNRIDGLSHEVKELRQIVTREMSNQIMREQHDVFKKLSENENIPFHSNTTSYVTYSLIPKVKIRVPKESNQSPKASRQGSKKGKRSSSK